MIQTLDSDADSEATGNSETFHTAYNLSQTTLKGDDLLHSNKNNGINFYSDVVPPKHNPFIINEMSSSKLSLKRKRQLYQIKGNF